MLIDAHTRGKGRYESAERVERDVERTLRRHLDYRAPETARTSGDWIPYMRMPTQQILPVD